MKRLSCFLLALGLALSLVVPAAPASASYQSDSNIWQWLASSGGIPQKVLGYLTGDSVCPDSHDGKHHASSSVYDNGAGHFTCTCDYCGETFVATSSDLHNAYDDYADDLSFTQVSNDHSLKLSPSGVSLVGFVKTYNLDDYTTLDFDLSSEFPDGLELGYNSVRYTGGRVALSHDSRYGASPAVIGSFIAPTSGTYTLYAGYSSRHYYPTGNFYDDSVDVHVVSSTFHEARDVWDARLGCCGNNFTNCVHFSSSYQLYCLVTPAEDYFSEEFPSSERYITYDGDYSVVGDNNEVFHHEETIFNEDNSTFYNPVTDTSTNITNWNYDYSTRTYSMTDENGEEKTLTYGDENIVINDGGNTFNLYYGDVSQSGSGESGSGESGSGESGSGDSGTGLIAQVGHLLGTLVSGLLGGITAFLSAILSALTNLVEVIGEGFNGILEAVLGWFAELPQLFHGFLDFLTAVFGYMPAQILSMLSFGVAAVVFVGILKALRR